MSGLRPRWVRHDRARTLRLLAESAVVIYLLATIALLVRHDSWPTPDFLIPPLLLILILEGRGWRFVVDWLPFLVLLLTYEAFRDIADDLNQRVHYQELISADKWLLSNEETAPGLLQDRFFRPGRTAWYDWAAAVFHMGHFVVPSVVGFVIWLRDRATYWRYTITVLGLFYAGFIAYVLYPAAPPWMASEQGLIPPVERILVHTLSTLPATEGLARIYEDLSPNDVAAMPSIHAAAQLLVAMVAASLWGRRALIGFAYAFAAGLAYMYLGEHYLVDILLGWLFAVGAFVIFWLGVPRLARRLETDDWQLPTVARRIRPPPSWTLAVVVILFIVYVWFDPLVATPNP